MSHIKPEAIEAVSTRLLKCRIDDDAPISLLPGRGDRYHVAWVVLTEIRDAIYSDGPDADAIRDALGLALRKEYGRGKAGGIADGRRAVGEWQEVQL